MSQKMHGRGSVSAGPLTAVALAAALVAGAVALSPPHRAEASVPAQPPAFTAPLAFTNPYFPFAPGAVKVFRGVDEGARTVVVDLYMAGTRTFGLGAAQVTCAVLREVEFEDGELVEISENYFAQADDGTVYYFGEVVDDYEDGVVVDHEGSWLVGGPAAGDPPQTLPVATPAVFCLANPEIGDVFKPEDVPGGPQETDTVRRTDRTVKVPAGRFTGCLEIGEVSLPDSRETKWYAPGVGVVQAKGRGEVLKLESTTLRAK
jgi:hypothetical protein